VFISCKRLFFDLIFPVFGVIFLITLSFSADNNNSDLSLSSKELFSIYDYDENDLQILQDIITLNNLDIEPLELGEQAWSNERLVYLDISNQYELTLLPDNFGDLEMLVELNLDENNLTSLPVSLFDIPQLGNLSLRHNQLSTLPEILSEPYPLPV